MKEKKIRSDKHRRYVASMPCIVTGATDGVQAHHLLRAGGKGMGTKACDSLTVPLHYTVHNALHSCGNEEVFFLNHGFAYETIKEIAIQLCLSSPCKKVNQLYRS